MGREPKYARSMSDKERSQLARHCKESDGKRRVEIWLDELDVVILDYLKTEYRWSNRGNVISNLLRKQDYDKGKVSKAWSERVLKFRPTPPPKVLDME